MDIFETLRIEHAGLRFLLDEVIEAGSGSQPDKARSALEDLRIALIAHNRAEEETLYELLSEEPHRPDLADLKTEEHHLTEGLLAELEQLEPGSNTWDMNLSLLKTQLETHVAEEETLIFSIVQDLLDDRKAEELAADFERKRDAVESTLDHARLARLARLRALVTSHRPESQR